MRSTGPTATSRPAALPPAVLSPRGLPEYVLVQKAEWERMLLADMVAEATAALSDPNMESIALEDVGKMLARDSIVRARKAKGLTQKQLGKLAKMQQSQIARLEKHPEAMTLRTLRRVAKALGVDVSALIS